MNLDLIEQAGMALRDTRAIHNHVPVADSLLRRFDSDRKVVDESHSATPLPTSISALVVAVFVLPFRSTALVRPSKSRYNVRAPAPAGGSVDPDRTIGAERKIGPPHGEPLDSTLWSQ